MASFEFIDENGAARVCGGANISGQNGRSN
jgi:hypothetical protein